MRTIPGGSSFQTYAYLELGRHYFNGIGFEKNIATAVYWYRSAADEGRPEGCNALGEVYENDKSLQDYDKAFRYFQISAMQGYVFSQIKLGDFYTDGTSVEQDYVKASEWYQYYRVLSSCFTSIRLKNYKSLD